MANYNASYRHQIDPDTLNALQRMWALACAARLAAYKNEVLVRADEYLAWLRQDGT